LTNYSWEQDFRWIPIKKSEAVPHSKPSLISHHQEEWQPPLEGHMHCTCSSFGVRGEPAVLQYAFPRFKAQIFIAFASSKRPAKA